MSARPVAAFVSIAALLLVPTLFALGWIGFAPRRRPNVLATMAVPLVFGVVLLLARGCIGLAGAWLLIPAVQMYFLYAVAEIFVRLSGRELNNILENFIDIRQVLDTIVCTLALAVIVLIPSLFFYQVFVVNEMCSA